MPELVSGVLLEPAEVRYAVSAFDVLLQGRRPSARLAGFIARLRESGAETGVSPSAAGAGVRVIAPDHDSGQFRRCDLLDSTEAAKVLGISPNGCRDLARRGSLVGFRAGGRWLFVASSVVARAERRAARG